MPIRLCQIIVHSDAEKMLTRARLVSLIMNTIERIQSLSVNALLVGSRLRRRKRTYFVIVQMYEVGLQVPPHSRGRAAHPTRASIWKCPAARLWLRAKARVAHVAHCGRCVACRSVNKCRREAQRRSDGVKKIKGMRRGSAGGGGVIGVEKGCASCGIY